MACYDRRGTVSNTFEDWILTESRRPRDRVAEGIRTKLGYPLKLAQVLEAATWKGGREIAKEKRPATGGPPIEIESDGTVF